MRLAYLGVMGLFAATVVWGFSATYLGPLLSGRAQVFWFIHIHAAVFLGWTAFLMAQTVLVASGQVRLHREVGATGMAFGALVVCVGLAISIAAPVARLHAGQMPLERAGLVALYNLTDIVLFAGFFAAAMMSRRAPARHRRLIVCATTALTGAAVGRVLPGGSAAYLAVWLTPLVLAFAVEAAAERKPSPILLLGGALFVAVAFKVQLYALSPFSGRLGQALIAPFV
jgi:hypothetical protein